MLHKMNPLHDTGIFPLHMTLSFQITPYVVQSRVIKIDIEDDALQRQVYMLLCGMHTLKLKLYVMKL